MKVASIAIRMSIPLPAGPASPGALP
jgi:hypothetical protein